MEKRKKLIKKEEAKVMGKIDIRMDGLQLIYELPAYSAIIKCPSGWSACYYDGKSNAYKYKGPIVPNIWLAMWELIEWHKKACIKPKRKRSTR